MNRTAIQSSLAAIALAATMLTAQAQTPDPHHPAPGTPVAPQMPVPNSQQGMPMNGSMTQGGQSPAMGGEMGRMMEMMRPMMGERRGMGMPFEHVEGRIAYLRAELKITDAQSAPWNAFAETMRANATAMKTMHDGMTNTGMPATMPDRMTAMHKVMSAQVGMMERSEASVKALYAALTPEQRTAFDQMMSGPMGMM